MDKAKSYAEPEVVDDSEDDSEAEDGTKIKPKLSQCPHAAAAEDSEDEESEDEARHPLIVHDRDPEQNLEALRNPDAYRQNLA